jgi:hypothetical protein
MRIFASALLICACGGGGGSQDSAVDHMLVDAAPDAPGSDGGLPIEISKYPRDGETFVPLTTNAVLPLMTGFQGFHLSELQLRVPASISDSAPTFNLAYTLSTSTDPPSQQTGTVMLMPAASGSRLSERYVIYFNQFSLAQLDGAHCHLQGTLATSPAATLDVTVTLQHSECVDFGTSVVCPDGGVP